MLERSLNPPDEETYECPVCGEEIPYGTYLYFNDMGDVVGCEYCISKRCVEDYMEDVDEGIREDLYDDSY